MKYCKYTFSHACPRLSSSAVLHDVMCFLCNLAGNNVTHVRSEAVSFSWAMGKKRRRSEVSGSDPEEYDSRKRKCKEKWTVAEAVNKQVGVLY